MKVKASQAIETRKQWQSGTYIQASTDEHYRQPAVSNKVKPSKVSVKQGVPVPFKAPDSVKPFVSIAARFR
jgi:hypothetical protein